MMFHMNPLSTNVLLYDTCYTYAKCLAWEEELLYKNIEYTNLNLTYKSSLMKTSSFNWCARIECAKVIISMLQLQTIVIGVIYSWIR